MSLCEHLGFRTKNRISAVTYEVMQYRLCVSICMSTVLNLRWYCAVKNTIYELQNTDKPHKEAVSV